MARVTITLEDTVDLQSGQEGVKLSAQVDPQGRPKGAPHTQAEICAIGIDRLWKSRALPPLVGLVCGDMTGLFQRARPPMPQNLAQAPKADKTGATDAKAVEVQPPAPSVDGVVPPAAAPAGE